MSKRYVKLPISTEIDCDLVKKIIHEIDLDHTAKLSAFATAIEEHHENELNKYRDELVEEENGH